jgi:hypothetical protein
MEPHRYGCRICDAVHIGTFTVYPETIRVVRKITRDKAGAVKSVESEYECVSHPEAP